MITMKKILLIANLFIVFQVFSKEIYVAKNGNDTNAGTLEAPYLTISKAASVAVAGDIVFIKEGTYEETLTPANSGSAGSPIIFQSFPGDRVIITAMEALSGWTQDSGSIYKTVIPFTSLGQENFVMNGETALDLARWPNKVDANPFLLSTLRNTGGSVSTVSTGAYLTESTIPGIDWTGGSVFFYGDKAGSGWISWKETITSSSAGRVNFNLIKNPDWIRTFHAPADLGDFYLEGVKGALDYKNEWYYNPTTKELFVQLPNGSAPVDGLVKMRRRNEVINLKDRSYIEIRNLAVFGGSINMEDSSTWYASNGNSKTTNNVLYGVSSFYGAQTLGVYTSFSAGKPSINMQGSFNTIEKCEIAFGAATGLAVRGENHLIKENRIHDFNYLGSYDAPVVLRGMNNSKFLRNTVFNGGRDGINYSGTNNEIAYNDVSRSNLLADDCALFYTVGSQVGTEIHHNWFHDAASSGTKKKAAGVYLDNDAAGFSVHHNVIWNTEWTSVQINWNGTDINIYNNTLFNADGVMGAWHKDGTAFSNVKVWNNLGSDDKWEPQSDKQNNLTITSSVFNDAANGNFTLKAGSSPIDQGKVIAGITDGFVGSNPDVGAYEFGGTNWTTGITWNYKYSPNGLGCYGLPGEDCINLPKDDADKDGVADANDECPNTPLGTIVNTKGCPVFQIANDNFKILKKDETCRSSNNGSITITAVDFDTYSAKIEGTSTVKAFATNTLVFDNLSAGEYTVCMTTTKNSEFKQCFSVVIAEPKDLKVSAKVENNNKQVVLSLEGSDLYEIELNGIVSTTSKSTVVLNLKNGENTVSVKTAIDCQGVYTDRFQLFDGIMIYPSLVKNECTISFSSEVMEEVLVQVVSSNGQLVFNEYKDVTNGKTIINLSNLSTGVYYVKVNSKNNNYNSKIIKQ